MAVFFLKKYYSFITKKTYMNSFKKLITLSCLVLLIGSCKKDDAPAPAPNPVSSFAATLTGASEVPANASTATGSATGSYNSTTKILILSTTYAGLTVTAGHIHKAAVGLTGPVEFPFVITASPIVYTSSALTASEETDLMEGKFYVNLHSVAFPGGEIRGQFLKQ
jgi:hypothetical protein